MTVPVPASLPIGLADQAKPEPMLVTNASTALSSTNNGFPESVARTFNRFGQEVQRMEGPAAPPAAMRGELGNAHIEIEPDASNTAAGKSVNGAAATAPQLALMLQTFDLSINTELVSRAVSEFTGSVNTLVKTQ